MREAALRHNVYATFKLYMLLDEGYMRHVDSMVEISNAFYEYCFHKFDPNMSADTAYCLCTSILPPITRRGYAIHLLLTALELKELTRSNLPLKDVEAVEFEPSDEPEGFLHR